MPEVLVKFGKHVDMPVTELVKTQKMYCAWVLKKAESGMGSKVLNELADHIQLVKTNNLSKMGYMMQDGEAQEAVTNLKNADFAKGGVLKNGGTQTGHIGNKLTMTVDGIEVGAIVNIEGVSVATNKKTEAMSITNFMNGLTIAGFAGFVTHLEDYPEDALIVFTVDSDTTLDVLYGTTSYAVFDRVKGTLLGSH